MFLELEHVKFMNYSNHQWRNLKNTAIIACLTTKFAISYHGDK